MFTTIAWWQSVNPANAYVQLAAPFDPTVFVQSPKIMCPLLNNVVLMSTGLETTVQPRSRLVSPSLLTLDRWQICPFNNAAAAAVVPLSPPRYMDLRDSPIVLTPGEMLTNEILSNPAAAQIQWTVICLADGPIKVVAGKIYTVRLTSAVAVTAGAWSAIQPVFDDQLPRGRYQLVGLRGQSATVVALRAIIPGYAWRPGVLGSPNLQDAEFKYTRMGGMGVFGEFEDTAPPSIEWLCNAADAAQIIFYDLIQVRSGP